jgi:lysine decarboxylase
VQAALDAHPSVRAVFLGDPSYVGTFGDIAAHAEVAHRHGAPLVVDAAWAAHFGFHPGLPAHALAQGADGLVTSAHKSLPAYSMGALVLARTERIDLARLDAGVEATASTSPAAAILASIDAARALMERDGEELLARTLSIVAAARERISAEPGLRVVSGPWVDPTKLVVLFSAAGVDGNLVADDLIAQNMMMELEDRDTMIAMVTVADDERTVDRFVTALLESVRRHRGQPREHVPSASWLVDPDTAMSPREAFFAAHATLAAAAAVGRVSAELIAPYPPGIPVLAPGERITAEVVDMLRSARAAGTRLAYAADPTLETFRVVA